MIPKHLYTLEELELLFQNDLDDNEEWVTIRSHEFAPSNILSEMAPVIYDQCFQEWRDKSVHYDFERDQYYFF